MNVKPLNDRVLVRRTESLNRTAGGIYIPDTAKEKPQEGVVIAVGPGRLEGSERIAVGVKEGDKVLFAKFVGTEVRVEGIDYMLLREEEIYAVIEA